MQPPSRVEASTGLGLAPRLVIFLECLRKEIERAGLNNEEIGMVSYGSAAPPPSMNGAQKQAVSVLYARSLTQTFYLPVALSCLTAVGALGMEWRSVKQKAPSLEQDGSNGSPDEKRETKGTIQRNNAVELQHSWS